MGSVPASPHADAMPGWSPAATKQRARAAWSHRPLPHPPVTSACGEGLVVRLEEPGGALTAADAHGDHAVARLAAEHLVGEGADHARARHAEGMAYRDRAAIDVELLRIDTEPVAAVDDLRGERLVQLPHVDVVDLEVVAREELRYREHGADAHLVRLAAGDREAAEDELRADAEGLGAVHGHDERRAGAVGELRGVARGDRPLTGVLVEVRR